MRVTKFYLVIIGALISFLIAYPFIFSVSYIALPDNSAKDFTGIYKESLNDVTNGNYSIWKPNCDKENKFYVKSDNNKISVNWCDQEEFNRRKASALTFNNKEIYMNREDSSIILPSYLLHELGHTLNYDHKDGGIMSYNIISNPMKERKNLHYTTRHTAREYEGFRIIDWTEKDMEFLKKEYKNGNISKSTWNNLEKSEYSTIYYTKDFKNYGGVKEMRKRFYRKPWLYK